MKLYNPIYRTYGGKIPYEFIRKINIGDKVIVIDNGSSHEGRIKSITYSGVGVELFPHVKFYKWFNVKEIIKDDEN